MRIIQMHNNGPEANGPEADGSPEVNQILKDEKQEEAKDGVSGERFANFPRNSGAKEVANCISGVNGQFQVDTQRSQGQSISWERFLPLKSLKVLLVENDDSTRQIVSALLRNCSYEVIAVSNGQQAWRLLEDLNNQIDLVLTEVVMPGLSGIGLLSKIMNHKSYKNLPVIMMSSHDSMGIVFKCLSKGAVDFLVKPLRKNELKNLWQHIWRKCHSSSGSGSESGVRTQKSTKLRSGEESDNGIASSEEYDDRSVGQFVREGSDHGSDTQSSWTKKAVEVDSIQAVSPWEQLTDPPDSTCAQVIHSRPEAFASSWVPIPAKEHKELDDQLGNVIMGKDSQTGTTGNPDEQPEEPKRKTLAAVIVKDNDLSAPLDLKKDGQNFDKASIRLGSEKLKTKQAADLIIGSALPSGLFEISKIKDKSAEKSKELPSLELTLKTIGDVSDIRPVNQDQNILRHSELSAFTKYQAGSNANPAQTGNVGRCSPLDNSSDAAKTDSTRNPQSNSSGTPPIQGSNNSSNNNDMGSTTHRSFTKATIELIDKPTAKTTTCLVGGVNTSAFQPVNGGLESGSQSIFCEKNASSHTVPVQANRTGKEVQVQHHHHHYHHHHHHHHCLKQLNHGDDLSQNKNNLGMETLQCGSFNVVRNPVEVNNVAANFSINGSASGSNHGSNLHNVSIAPLDVEGTNGTNAKGEACDASGSGSGSGTGVDHGRSAQREAALNKFRQKRKERCFEKKVQYQSRKKLAEQRPHVRGQFIKQVQENKSKETDS